MLDTRAEILSVARKLIARQGLGPTPMEQIRRAAQVSNGSLFHFFPTKDSLAAALYVEALVEYQGYVVGAMQRHARAEAAVRALVEAHFEWVLAAPDKTRVLHELRRAAEAEGALPAIEEANAKTYRELKAWLRGHIEAGAIRELSLELFLALALGPAMQITRSWLDRPDPRRARRAVPVLVEAAWRAVGAQRYRAAPKK